jgi:hypothetical protein
MICYPSLDCASWNSIDHCVCGVDERGLGWSEGHGLWRAGICGRHFCRLQGRIFQLISVLSIAGHTAECSRLYRYFEELWFIFSSYVIMTLSVRPLLDNPTLHVEPSFCKSQYIVQRSSGRMRFTYDIPNPLPLCFNPLGISCRLCFWRLCGVPSTSSSSLALLNPLSFSSFLSWPSDHSISSPISGISPSSGL